MFKILHIPTATFVKKVGAISPSSLVDRKFRELGDAQHYLESAQGAITTKDGNIVLTHLIGRPLIREHFLVVNVEEK